MTLIFEFMFKFFLSKNKHGKRSKISTQFIILIKNKQYVNSKRN